MPRPSKKGKELDAVQGKMASNQKTFRIQDVDFKVGDSVLVRGDQAENPFVGKIVKFKSSGKNTTSVRVAWYYRPEECKCGRRVFHGEKELFQSDHMDWIDAATISEKCSVYSIEEYKKLSETSDTEYFTRFTYNPSKDEFEPKEVAVYCNCEFPYNPDVFMLSCNDCNEWFHPRCIQLSDEEVGKYEKEPFICPDCKTTTGPKRKRDS